MEPVKLTMNERNTRTVEKKLIQMEDENRNLQIQIDGIKNYMSTLENKYNQLEHRLNLDKITSLGSGPSVRG